MSQKNSKNISFLVLLIVILIITFTYTFTFYYNGETLYTGVKEISKG